MILIISLNCNVANVLLTNDMIKIVTQTSISFGTKF